MLVRAVRAAGALGGRLPLPTAQLLGRILGALAFRLARRQRRHALRNLSIAFPEWSADEHRLTIRAMFLHFGMMLFELPWLRNLTIENLARTTVVENIEPMVEWVKKGGSIVLFTGHCGNWEWIAYVIGLHVPLTVMQRERREPGLDDFIDAVRAGSQIAAIDRGTPSSGRDLIRALKRPGVVGFLIDQSLRVESVRIPFFGKEAPTPIGPAKLAVRNGNAVCWVVASRLKDGRHYIRFAGPFEMRPDSDPVNITAAATAFIEEQIRRVPSQWVWMHERWKQRPSWDVTETMGSSSGGE